MKVYRDRTVLQRERDAVEHRSPGRAECRFWSHARFDRLITEYRRAALRVERDERVGLTLGQWGRCPGTLVMRGSPGTLLTPGWCSAGEDDMARVWIQLACAAMAVSLAAGCSTGTDVEDVEAALVEQYIDPLTGTGIAVSVQSACRYAGPIDLPWHLSVELLLDATPARVADVLEGEGMVVRRDRLPMLVQQVPDAPSQGWNGSLGASEEGSALTLVFNNATRSGWSGSVGWADLCPGSGGPPAVTPAPDRRTQIDRP